MTTSPIQLGKKIPTRIVPVLPTLCAMQVRPRPREGGRVNSPVRITVVRVYSLLNRALVGGS